MSSSVTDVSRSRPPGTFPLTCERHQSIGSIADAWDRLVPRDSPHLRAGFLKVIEHSGMVQDPCYLMVYQGGQPAAVALAYTLMVDGAQTATAARRRWIDWIRKRFPGFQRRPLRICGSPVGNAESGICFAPQLPASIRQQAFHRIVQEVLHSTTIQQTMFFKEFPQEAVAEYASGLEKLGFFAVDPGPGTRLDLRWPSFDDYLGSMHKRYRARIRKDLKAAEALEFRLLDSFAELAPIATPLYLNVIGHAEFTLQKATESFFAAVSDFDQAKLLVARDRSTGEIAGVDLLLFGDTCMHNLYVGFDDATNERFHTYFSLVEHSVRLAMENHCQVCYLGQASYEFKSRLGAIPYPVTAYMKHRLWPVHYLLRSSRDRFYPTSDVVTHDVFHAEDGTDE